MLSFAFALDTGAEHRDTSPGHGGCIGLASVLGPHLPCKRASHGARRQTQVLGEHAAALNRQQPQHGVHQHSLWGGIANAVHKVAASLIVYLP